MIIRIAQCSCGALRIKAEGHPAAIVICHCRECQRRTGSVFGVGAYYQRDRVEITGHSSIYVRDAAEGRKFRTHFCPTCGTSLYWETDRHPVLIGVTVGAFCDPEFPVPSRSVWEQTKHHWVGLPASIEHYSQGRG
jgi:hypothetical protein